VGSQITRGEGRGGSQGGLEAGEGSEGRGEEPSPARAAGAPQVPSPSRRFRVRTPSLWEPVSGVRGTVTGCRAE